MVQTNCVNKSKILIICGATASGKTALAVECAKLLNSEVISADSLYIYKGLNIGTAKPNEVEMDGIKHHLIDVVDAKENFSVSDYKEIAQPIIDHLIAKGKVPIICGGTGFYVNSLLYDLSYGNGSANLEAREKYKKLAEERGNEYVYDILLKNDPESAKKLHFNDVKRVIRALEIYESGNLKSEIKDDFTPKYDYKAFAVDFPREKLYDRINRRVDLMFESGLLDEIKTLLDNEIDKTNQCMQGIGYKEVFDYLDGKINLNELKELIKLNTRHYAKRQITFFKRLNGLVWLKPEDTKELARRIIGEL